MAGENLKVPVPFFEELPEEKKEEKQEHREEEEKDVCADSHQTENSHGGDESTQSLKDTQNEAIESEENKQDKQSASKNENESVNANVSKSDDNAKSENENDNTSESKSKNESENDSEEESMSESESENDDTNESESNTKSESENESVSESKDESDSNSENESVSEDEEENESVSENDSENESESENENEDNNNEGDRESENEGESDSEEDNENEDEADYENQQQQQFSYRFNTDDVVQVNIDYVALHYQTAFQRFIERIAEEETKAIDYSNENDKYNVKKLMFRQYERRSLNAYKVSRVYESVILILDTSGSMDWWARNLSLMASLALQRKDVEIYIAPNGYVEYQYTLKGNKKVNHDKKMKEWKNRVIIFVGDFDGADTPVYLSQNNNVIYVCPESRYRFFASHDWVHYKEEDFKGVFIRAFDIDEMFIAFKMITRKYRLWLDLHTDGEFTDDCRR